MAAKCAECRVETDPYLGPWMNTKSASQATEIEQLSALCTDIDVHRGDATDVSASFFPGPWQTIIKLTRYSKAPTLPKNEAPQGTWTNL